MQSSSIQLAITEHRPCAPEHLTVDMCNVQAPVNEVNPPKTDVDRAMALEQHVVRPHALVDEISEVLECTGSINHRSSPAISSMNIGAEVRITQEMSNNTGVSALTRCNASASVDPRSALNSGGPRLTTNVPPLQGLHHSCRDPTRNNQSSESQFTPQNLDLVQKVRSTTATLDNQRMLKPSSFPPATVAHDKNFQYATVSNQWAGNNPKNNLSLNDQEDCRTLVLVNLINPIQTNGVGHTSTPITINHGHPTMEFMKTTASGFCSIFVSKYLSKASAQFLYFYFSLVLVTYIFQWHLHKTSLFFLFPCIWLHTETMIVCRKTLWTSSYL